MDINVVKNKAQRIIKKYKYSILVLLIGMVLMALPSKGLFKKEQTAEIKTTISEEPLEQRLSIILSQVSGAGKVEVLLTPSAGEEVIYQTNCDSSFGDTTEHLKNDTVTITNSDRNQTGLVKQINPVQYGGAVIICEGADNPAVCLAIVDAVSKATGLGANKISVLKME